jgi:cell division septal protein FtsQ
MAIEYYYTDKGAETKIRSKSKRSLQMMDTPQEARKRGVQVDYRALAITVAGLSLIYLAWWLLLSTFFQIHTIDFSREPSPPLRAVIEKLKGENILTMRLNAMTAKLQHDNPALKSVNLYRGLPDILRVDIVERTGALFWKTQEQYYRLDGSGVVFEAVNVAQTQGSLVIIDDSNLPVALGQKILSVEFVKDIQRILDELPAIANNESIKEIHVGESMYTIAVVTDQNVKILFDITQPLDLQFDAVKQVYLSNRPDIKEYADVRVIGKAYLK